MVRNRPNTTKYANDEIPPECPKAVHYSLFYNWLHYFLPLRLGGGIVKVGEERCYRINHNVFFCVFFYQFGTCLGLLKILQNNK